MVKGPNRASPENLMVLEIVKDVNTFYGISRAK
jgi:hypothetical protein